MLTMNKHHTNAKDPLFHVVKRDTIPFRKSILIRIIAVVAALLFCSLLSVFLIHANPVEFLSTLFAGTFGSARRLWKFAKDTAVLLCIALAITPAFRMRFWNIGAEGQTFVGALSAAAVAYYLGSYFSNGILLILMLAAAVIAGAIWSGLPAIFKAKWETNETLFTLMMNYVAEALVLFFVQIWANGQTTMRKLENGHLPIIGHQYLLLILSVLVITVLMYVYLHHTKQGYEISVVGESENTARYVGINVKKVVIRTMLLSGALCGVAGFLMVAALNHSISTTTMGGIGFTAIMVSWLAKFNPFIMIGTAAFISFLETGSSQIVSTFDIDTAFPDMVVGIFIFFIIGCEFFISYQLKFRSKSQKGANKAS